MRIIARLSSALLVGLVAVCLSAMPALAVLPPSAASAGASLTVDTGGEPGVHVRSPQRAAANDNEDKDKDKPKKCPTKPCPKEDD